VEYEEQNEIDSSSQKIDLVVGSGSYTTAQAWELSASHTREDFSGPQDNKVSIFRGEFIQQITRRWALAFAAGYEDFDLANEEDVDGELWSLGIVFTPTNRTRFSIGGGERAFGDDYYVDFEHQASKSVWQLNYKREYISARDEVAYDSLFQRQDEFGNLVRDPVLDSPPSVSVVGISTLSAEYYETDRVNASYTFRTLRTLIQLRAGFIKRDYSVDSQDTEDTSASLSLNRVISRRFRGLTQFLWVDHEQDLNVYDEWSAVLGLVYTLGANTSLSLGYTHLERDGETELTSFEENRVTIGLVSSF
jgi:uncharacterized protein (PEP-CTERM system associated)